MAAIREFFAFSLFVNRIAAVMTYTLDGLKPAIARVSAVRVIREHWR